MAYSAIPYAAPPVGERRWCPPVRPRRWAGVRDATLPSTPCPQHGMAGITGAEDCLYLDVTVPRDARPGRRLPVLVWLHGGAFVVGGAHEYGGARLAAAGGVMVVTLNYRLGALGFLSSRTAGDAAVHQPVYAYEFAEDSGETFDGFPMGSYHGLDLPYVWDVRIAWNPYPPLTVEQQRLSSTIVQYWSSFVHTGDPNGQGRPQWSDFGRAGTVLGLSTVGIAPTPFSDNHRCGFWSGRPR